MASSDSGPPIDIPMIAGWERLRLSLDAVIEIETASGAISAKLLVVTSERLAVLDRVWRRQMSRDGKVAGQSKSSCVGNKQMIPAAWNMRK